jgi:hypothetical protein
VANVAFEAFVLNQETPISSFHFPSSTFIDLGNSSDEDVCLLVSSNVDVFGSFSTLILNGSCALKSKSSSRLELQNHNILFESNVYCTHLSNELRPLNYNKIKFQYVSSLPITFNNDIIFEFSPIHLPTTMMDKCKACTTSMMVMFGAR